MNLRFLMTFLMPRQNVSTFYDLEVLALRVGRVPLVGIFCFSIQIHFAILLRMRLSVSESTVFFGTCNASNLSLLCSILLCGKWKLLLFLGFCKHGVIYMVL